MLPACLGVTDSWESSCSWGPFLERLCACRATDSWFLVSLVVAGLGFSFPKRLLYAHWIFLQIDLLFQYRRGSGASL